MIHPDYIYIFCVRSIERFRDVEKSILPGFGHLPCWRAFSVPFREERPQDFTARGLFLKHKLSCTLQGRLLPQLPRPQVQSPSPRRSSQPLSQRPNCQMRPYRTRNGFPHGTALLPLGTRSHTALAVLYLSKAWFLTRPPRNLCWILRWELSGLAGGVHFLSVSISLFLLY